MILHMEKTTVFSNCHAWLKQYWRQPRLEWLGLVISISKKEFMSGSTGREAAESVRSGVCVKGTDVFGNACFGL